MRPIKNIDNNDYIKNPFELSRRLTRIIQSIEYNSFEKYAVKISGIVKVNNRSGVYIVSKRYTIKNRSIGWIMRRFTESYIKSSIEKTYRNSSSNKIVNILCKKENNNKLEEVNINSDNIESNNKIDNNTNNNNNNYNISNIIIKEFSINKI